MNTQTKTVRLLGVPMDLGAGRRGVDMGPSAIRIAGVSHELRRLGFAVEDDGDIGVPAPETRDPGQPNARYLDAIYHVCNRLRLRVRRTLDDGRIPLVMGGDHSIAIGTVAGIAEHFRMQDQKVGLIWVDAHADMNTPEISPSGNIHGMPLATLLGYGSERLVELAGFSPKVEKQHVCLIGIRDIDEGEREMVKKSGIHAYTMRDVDERGMRAIMQEAIGFATDGTAGFHVSFDLDGMDPRDVSRAVAQKQP